MYAGQIQEQGRVDDVLANPQHPYTKALIQAVPDPDSTDQRLHQIEGQPPDLLNLPDGCSFADRCGLRHAEMPGRAPGTLRVCCGDRRSLSLVRAGSGCAPVTEPLIKVRGLRKAFPVREGMVLRKKVGEIVAVDDVSFDVFEGETLGCVGGSGSGKSTSGG